MYFEVQMILIKATKATFVWHVVREVISILISVDEVVIESQVFWNNSCITIYYINYLFNYISTKQSNHIYIYVQYPAEKSERPLGGLLLNATVGHLHRIRFAGRLHCTDVDGKRETMGRITIVLRINWSVPKLSPSFSLPPDGTDVNFLCQVCYLHLLCLSFTCDSCLTLATRLWLIYSNIGNW